MPTACFLSHLRFCRDDAARHDPAHPPNVALLHAILGTATNTFAMRADKLPRLPALRCHRVIDNAPLRIDAANLWINLNDHLMRVVDFMPAASWPTHRSDPLQQMFERVFNLLDRAGQRLAAGPGAQAQARPPVGAPRRGAVRARPARPAGLGGLSAVAPGAAPTRTTARLPCPAAS